MNRPLSAWGDYRPALNITQAQWKATKLDGPIVYQLTGDALSWPDARLRGELAKIKAAAPKHLPWGIALHCMSPKGDAAAQKTLFPWGNDARWERLHRQLALVAAVTKRIYWDAELYNCQYQEPTPGELIFAPGAQHPLMAWAGPAPLMEKRARDLARHLRALKVTHTGFTCWLANSLPCGKFREFWGAYREGWQEERFTVFPVDTQERPEECAAAKERARQVVGTAQVLPLLYARPHMWANRIPKEFREALARIPGWKYSRTYGEKEVSLLIQEAGDGVCLWWDGNGLLLGPEEAPEIAGAIGAVAARCKG